MVDLWHIERLLHPWGTDGGHLQYKYLHQLSGCSTSLLCGQCWLLQCGVLAVLALGYVAQANWVKLVVRKASSVMGAELDSDREEDERGKMKAITDSPSFILSVVR